ncbi:MAG: MBL fold metallo-hydrolase, partial [Anaerolineales bacterium]
MVIAKDLLTLRWLGVGGIELHYQGTTLLVDPFLTRPSLGRLIFLQLHPDQQLISKIVSEADGILITHAHYDHLMDVPVILAMTGAKAFGSRSTVQILEVNGVDNQQCQIVAPNEKYHIGAFQFQALLGGHISLPFLSKPKPLEKFKAPLRFWDYQMDVCYSFFIQTNSHSILVWHNPSAADAPAAQILLFDTDMSDSELKTLITRVQPNFIIPIHWDNFFR